MRHGDWLNFFQGRIENTGVVRRIRTRKYEKGWYMKLRKVLLVCALVLISVPAYAQERLRLATTTSTENSGLLGVLLPPFEEQFGLKVDVIAVGTGKALKLGENGDVDVVLVHARQLEDAFVENGFGVNRRDVMYNDFVVVGPKEDPAGIEEKTAAAAVFRALGEAKTPFISRGDNSGTHQNEKQLWQAAKVEPKGSWYMAAGQGMGAVLKIADEKRGYTLTDRGTLLAYADQLDLVVLFEGVPELFNPYGIIAVNPAVHPHVQYAQAMQLIEWMTSPQGRQYIASYKKNGRNLFFPATLPGEPAPEASVVPVAGEVAH